LIIKLVFKICYYNFGYQRKLVTKKINYLSFGYQNDLVTKLVSN